MDDTLDRLTDPGTSDTSDTRDTMVTADSSGTSDARGNGSASVARVPSGTEVTSGASGTNGTRARHGSRVGQGSDDSAGNRGTSDNKPVTEPREHVKVRRSLAAEMRDAVWFLSEHGRPRVQLGEIFDEAVGEWLEKAKAAYNGGEAFPRKGPLR